MIPKIVFIVTLFLACDNIHCAVIQEGKKIYAPNGKDYVFISEETFEDGGASNYYNISYQGKFFKLQNFANPTYRLEWSKDGKSFFTMNHQPHEVVAKIYHYHNKKDSGWIVYGVRPPFSRGTKYILEVYDWDLGDTEVKIFCRYSIIKKERIGRQKAQIDSFIANYIADVATGKTYDLKARKVNDDEYFKNWEKHDVERE
jgi:hypothetical protein